MTRYLTPYWMSIWQAYGNYIQDPNNAYFYWGDTVIYITPLTFEEYDRDVKVHLTFFNHDGKLQRFNSDSDPNANPQQPFVKFIPLMFGRTEKIKVSDLFPNGGQHWGWGACMVECEIPLLVSGEIFYGATGIASQFNGMTFRTIPFTEIPGKPALPTFKQEDQDYQQPFYNNNEQNSHAIY